MHTCIKTVSDCRSSCRVCPALGFITVNKKKPKFSFSREKRFYGKDVYFFNKRFLLVIFITTQPQFSGKWNNCKAQHFTVAFVSPCIKAPAVILRRIHHYSAGSTILRQVFGSLFFSLNLLRPYYSPAFIFVAGAKSYSNGFDLKQSALPQEAFSQKVVYRRRASFLVVLVRRIQKIPGIKQALISVKFWNPGIKNEKNSYQN